MANHSQRVPPKAKKQAKVKSPKTSAIVSRAEPPQDRLNDLIALYGQGRVGEAVLQAALLAAEFPEAAILYNILGAAHAGLGNMGMAIENFRKALQIKPDYAEAHNSLGIALQGQGRLDEAIASYDKALQIKPDLAESHNNRGAALKDQGRLDEAIASFGKALRINPRFTEAYNNLGAALKEQGRLDEAIANFSKALQINPRFVKAHISLGIALQDKGLMDEAIASFGKALKIQPDCVEAHSNLCGLYEKRNTLGEFEEAVEKAVLQCGDDNSEILFRSAQLAGRKNRFEDAVGYLNKVEVERIQPSLRAAYFSLLGKACDRLGQFDEAFSAFEKQNELAGASAEVTKFSADRYLSAIRKRTDSWMADVEPNWARLVAGSGQTSPTFMIGFPRSGTTLLDTILRSHPAISVVEEKPMVGAMIKGFKKRQTIEVLNALSESDVLGLRNAYFDELKNHLGRDDDGKLIVDKLPLNITHIGLIHRAFPDAKFILVLRHPCDCVLSCFMQTFKLNDAMANFLNLEQSAKLYAAVMELCSVYRQKLDIDLHVVKYEDLVQDLEGTCKPLIRFLGLEWDDNLHNYQKIALQRGSINTPSYSQVVQPLYTRASGRWTHYRKQMEPVLPVLQPWIEAFDY
jgi:tetratricopeptide (TPR) repeat protein